MSRQSRNATARRHEFAQAFAALGDETRLSLVGRLADGEPHSISELTEGLSVSRQAVTKHLQVLQDARVVRNERSGRENLFYLEAGPFQDLSEYLNFVSGQWDQALSRLKSFVE